MNLQSLIAQWSGTAPPQPCADDRPPTMPTQKMQEPSQHQARRYAGQSVSEMPESEGEILQAAPCRDGRRRRLPALRVPQAGPTAINMLI